MLLTALQDVSPEVQYTPQALRPEVFKHILGLTAQDVYALRALQPEVQKGQALRPGR